MNKAELQEFELAPRIAFIDITTSKIFFDCHPAEARLAINAIKDLRKNVDRTAESAVDLHYRNIVDGWVSRIMNVAVAGDPIAEFTPDNLNRSSYFKIENLGCVVSHLVMDVYTFSIIREWGKAFYEEQSDFHWLRAGRFGWLWTADIIVRKSAGPKFFYIASLSVEEKDDIAFKVNITA
jgi:hypothetical protein